VLPAQAIAARFASIPFFNLQLILYTYLLKKTLKQATELFLHGDMKLFS
jgi:hypothetical protein